jgi:flagellar protein FlaF
MDAAGSGRQIEISILEMAAGKLRSCLGETGEVAWSRDLDEAVRFNQKIWDVFTADWSNPQCPLDKSLRESLISLSVFVKKRSFKVISQPSRQGLTSLVQLNDNLVQGLRHSSSAGEKPALSES